MDEQLYGDMQVPGHITTGASAGGADAQAHAATAAEAALSEEAAALAASDAERRARVDRIRATAAERNIDLGDVNLDGLGAEQLAQFAAERLA